MMADSEHIVQTSVLSNGLRVVHMSSPSPVAYAGFFIDVGTRDEPPGQWGMAHLVEHMLFKGTRRRRSTHIINRLERVGGELNAYTQKEETVIYAVFIEEHVARAVELLSDLVFHSIFPEKELQKEIEVIMDEISAYEDSPSELIYDEFENLLFSGHELGHFILGEEETLHHLHSEDLSDFVQRYYTTDKIIFFYMGRTPYHKIHKLASVHMGEIPLSVSTNQREKNPELLPEMVVKEKGTSQSHTILGGYSYPMVHPKRQALSLLNNILGGPSLNSRLNMALREKRGYVYHVESSLTSYSDTGVFSIYFGGDVGKQQKCMEITHKELKKLREQQLTTSQLAAAKKQYVGQLGIVRSQQEFVALSMAKSHHYWQKWFSQREVIDSIEKISAKDLLEVANDVYLPDKMFCIQYR